MPVIPLIILVRLWSRDCHFSGFSSCCSDRYFAELVNNFYIVQIMQFYACFVRPRQRSPPQMTKKTASEVALYIHDRSETSKSRFCPIVYKSRTGPMVLKLRMLTNLTYLNEIQFTACKNSNSGQSYET